MLCFFTVEHEFVEVHSSFGFYGRAFEKQVHDEPKQIGYH